LYEVFFATFSEGEIDATIGSAAARLDYGITAAAKQLTHQPLEISSAQIE